MSARDFSKISPAMWRSARFAGLCDRGKIAFVYFCTNAHVTSAGVYELPDGYACADLKWEPDAYETIRKEVMEAGMIDFDPAHGVLLIERWFKHNPPMNDKHALGTTRLIANIESDRLREKATSAFEEANTARLQRQAEKEAERLARQSETVTRLKEMGLGNGHNSDRLTNTRFMQRGAAG
jgi:hypothetical protein